MPFSLIQVGLLRFRIAARMQKMLYRHIGSALSAGFRPGQHYGVPVGSFFPCPVRRTSLTMLVHARIARNRPRKIAGSTAHHPTNLVACIPRYPARKRFSPSRQRRSDTAHADHFGGGESPGACRMYLIETCFQLFIHILTSSGLHSSHSTTRVVGLSQCNLICEPAPISVSTSSFE